MIRAHWIKPNHTVRVPARWVFLDTEAVQTQQGAARHQMFRLGVTAFDRWDTGDRPRPPTEWRTHHTPADLWAYVDSRTRRRCRTVVVAHNLGYDLRLSRGFDILPSLGWRLHTMAVHDRAMSATFRRDGRSLVLCDSMAWLPMALDKIGAMVGLSKPPLPRWEDGEPDWERRCRADVEILRTAMLDLVQWVEDDDLGCWQRTGAGQAWAHWRHRHLTHRVLIHDDEEARAAEAAAMHTGRCEVWRHGPQRGRVLTEWDLPLAYPTIAAQVELPTRLVAHRYAPSWDWVQRASSSRRVLVKADVSTDVEVLPHSSGSGVTWPVGTFSGWWWEVELAAAIEHGAIVEPREAFTYAQAPFLASWARWALAAATDVAVTGSEVRKAAAKHQARALIGRFATRFDPWEEWGPALPDALPLERIADVEGDRHGRVLTLGADAWVSWRRQWGQDAFPAVTSVVMAEARMRLWRLMVTAGLDHLYYVDTDSLITNAAGSARLHRLVADGGGWGLRVKSHPTRLTLLGPRQLLVGDQPRIAGIAKGATWSGPDTLSGEVWQSTTAALAQGTADRVIITPKVWHVRATDRRRAHFAGGRTAPFTLVAGRRLREAPESPVEPFSPAPAPDRQRAALRRS